MVKRNRDAKKAAERQQLFRDSVVTMMREGRCTDAEDAAIQAADYDLADYVRRACSPAQ